MVNKWNTKWNLGNHKAVPYFHWYKKKQDYEINFILLLYYSKKKSNSVVIEHWIYNLNLPFFNTIKCQPLKRFPRKISKDILTVNKDLRNLFMKNWYCERDNMKSIDNILTKYNQTNFKSWKFLLKFVITSEFPLV